MRETITLTGIVLVSSPVREYDKRIEILTRERGRIPAFAQGARKQNSALSACTIPFTFGTFQVYEGRSAYIVKSGEIENYFANLADNYDSLCYASYFTEVARYLTRENIRADEELMLLYITFRALQRKNVPVKLIRRIFELRIMSLQGQTPELFVCIKCGNTDAFDVYMTEGGLICQNCAQKLELKRQHAVQLSHDARYTLQYIISSPIQKLYNFNVSDAVMDNIDKFMVKYLLQYLPHHFNASDFLS